MPWVTVGLVNVRWERAGRQGGELARSIEESKEIERELLASEKRFRIQWAREKAHLQLVSLASAFGFHFSLFPPTFLVPVYMHPTPCSYMKQIRRDGNRSPLL